MPEKASPDQGSQFLHQRNPQLHNSTEVGAVVDYLRQEGERIPNQPADKLSAHLRFLAERVNDGVLTGEEASVQRQIEAASIALTPENAHNYVKFQAKVAREQGHGEVVDPDTMDERIKMDLLRTIRQDQQAGLTEWIKELNSEETQYPDWFKFWAFDSITKLTDFNEDTGKDGQPKGFEKRSSSSFALFPELDRESLSLVHEAMVEKFGGQPMGFEYDAMRALLAKANFAELYTEAQNHGFSITDELKAVTTGTWQDFPQSDKRADARALADLVKSYRTGWCTAGLETAAHQLQGGEFFVWCSTNPTTGNDEVPRVAVRMENGQIAEVRGVVGGRRQELEPELMDTVMEKINDLPGGDKYFEKAENMKQVTALERRLVQNPDSELSREEVRFLYELNGPVIGFGYGDYDGFGRDPRVDELKALRGERDYAVLKELAVEHLQESFESGYAGYASVVEQLNQVRTQSGGEAIPVRSETEVKQLFDSKLAEWRESGLLNYAAERLISHGELYTPVGRANTVVRPAELKQLANNFATGQGFNEAYIYHQLYDSYTTQAEHEQLAGYQADGPDVVFELIPSKFTTELGTRPAGEQAEILEELQAAYPTYNIHVPSPLAAVAYWNVLRSRLDSLKAGAFELTGIRHFDFEPKQLDDWSGVPWSGVDVVGGPDLGSSDATNGGARLAMG